MFLNHKFSSCSLGKETEKQPPHPKKELTHTFEETPMFSCSGRQDVKSHPNPHISTPIIIRKKDSVVTLYIQMHLGIYTYVTLFNVIYIYNPPPFVIISYVKPSFKSKKDV